MMPKHKPASVVLAEKLISTAHGNGFHGDALEEAMKHPALSYEDKWVVQRWATGYQVDSDFWALQLIAINIAEYGDINE